MSTRNDKRRMNQCAGVALMVLALVGCSRSVSSSPGEVSNLQQWVDQAKAQPAPPLDPLPVMQQFETFEYDAHALRDPFSNAFEDKGTGSGPRPDPGRSRQLLEQFPLDSLDMVGTIGHGASITALITAPDKVTYKVKSGEYLGQSDGRVIAIYEDRLELVELVPDGSGGWAERAAAITLEELAAPAP